MYVRNTFPGKKTKNQIRAHAFIHNYYKNVVQYTIFKIKKENGKKNLENLSIYIAVACPWQNVSY